MKLPTIAELENASSLGPILASILTALGVTDDDLPDIVPDPPSRFASDDEAAAWVQAHMPAVAAKVEALEGGLS